MSRLQQVALGEGPADLVVAGGRVFLPEVGEFQRRDVAVVDNRVAALPENADPVVGEDTRVVDAEGRAVLPGFVDAHTHLDIHQSFETAYHYALEGGTTTVVTEASAFGSAFGAAGVKALLSATAYLPITVRVTVPPQPLVDTFTDAWADEREAAALSDLLADDRVVGVGETDWIHAVGREVPAERLYERARREGKRVVGHGAGCRGAKLTAFAGVVDDDHEATTPEGVVERVENGLHAVGRAGSIRDDLDAVAGAVDQVGPGELSLSTDGVWPEDCIGDGWMDEVVRRAIDAGVDPADAITMATLSPARHFGLDDRGSLAPGNVADVVVVDDLQSVNITTVVSGGEVVVHNHEATVAPRNVAYPDAFYDSVDVQTDPDAFAVPETAASDGRVRGLAYEGGLVSSPTTLSPAVVDGELHADPDAGVLKAALFDRRPGSDGGGFVGFCTGFGIEEGAVATTVTWETPGLLAAGADDDALSLAASHVAEMGGGWAVVRDGEVVAELPLRVGATCSDLEVEETAKLTSAVRAAVHRLGAAVERPLLGLQTLTFPGVPDRKLCFDGYAEVRDRRVVGLTPDEG